LKLITNWRNATVADIEADALLDEATKIHVLSYEMQSGGEGSFPEYERIARFFKYHIDKKIPIVMHNGIGYDVPLVEKLLGLDLSEVMLIDTLSVSWYLNTERMQHGLDSFFADYGIAKPKVGNHRWAAPKRESWLTEQGHQTRLRRHYQIMKHRCSTDVRINKALWEDLKERLISLYSRVKDAVDNGLVDGTRMSDDEVCYLVEEFSNNKIWIQGNHFNLVKEEPKQMFNIKTDPWFIRVNSEEESKVIQDWLFEQGIMWKHSSTQHKYTEYTFILNVFSEGSIPKRLLRTNEACEIHPTAKEIKQT